MITEDYVSFETAKLLKEKGFECATPHYYYDKDGNLLFSIWNIGAGKNTFVAPSLEIAMKWLREVHHIPIEILWHYDSNSDIEEWYFIHHAELRILPNNINYFDTYEEACEAAIKYCLENLI